MPETITTPQVVPSVLNTLDTVKQNIPLATTGDLQILGVGILAITAVIAVIILASTVLWIWSIVNIAKNPNFTDDNQKIIWLLVVIFTGVVGSLVYLFARPKPINK